MFSTHLLNAEHFGIIKNDLLQLWCYADFAKNKGVDICNDFDILFCIACAISAVGIYANEDRIFTFEFCCMVAMYFKECAGTTQSSRSAVVTKVDGYLH